MRTFMIIASAVYQFLTKRTFTIDVLLLVYIFKQLSKLTNVTTILAFRYGANEISKRFI